MIALPLAAIVLATLFTGAALYITLVEHPARLVLEDAALLAQWQPSYKRALPIQSGLAIACGLAGIAAWYLSGEWQWLVGSLIMLANWPFTLLAIKLAIGQCEPGHRPVFRATAKGDAYTNCAAAFPNSAK